MLSVQQCPIKHHCYNLGEPLAVYEQTQRKQIFHIHSWIFHINELKHILNWKHLPKHSKCIVFLNIDFAQYTFRKPCTKLIYALKLEKQSEVACIIFRIKETTKQKTGSLIRWASNSLFETIKKREIATSWNGETLKLNYSAWIAL